MWGGVERASVISSHQWFPDLGAAPCNHTVGVQMRRWVLGEVGAKDSMAVKQERF